MALNLVFMSDIRNGSLRKRKSFYVSCQRENGRNTEAGIETTGEQTQGTNTLLLLAASNVFCAHGDKYKRRRQLNRKKQKEKHKGKKKEIFHSSSLLFSRAYVNLNLFSG